MKFIKSAVFLIFINCHFAEAQNFTFFDIKSDVSTLGNDFAKHFTIGIGQNFSESTLFSQSINLRFTHFKRPNYFDVRSTPNKGEFLQSDLTTNYFNISYGIKRKLVGKLFLSANIEGGFIALKEDFRYWVKDGVTNDVIYTDAWKDSYKINLGYSFEVGLEYFIIRNNNFYLSTSFSFQSMDNIKDFKYDKRVGEFNRYDQDSSVVESAQINKLQTDYFWLVGIGLGVNIFK